MSRRHPRLRVLPLLGAAVLLAACGSEAAEPADPPAATSSAPAAGDPFLGKIVTVSGRVGDRVGIDAFRLQSEGAQGEPLKVVDAADVAVTDDQAVQVTGVVRIFDREALEKEFPVTLAAVELEDWDGEHVIVANQIRTLGVGTTAGPWRAPAP